MRLNMHMMINKTQALFNERLAGGLRIRELGNTEVDKAAQNISRDTVPAAGETAKTQPPIKASISDTGKFACEFLRRCRASSQGDEQSAALLTESLLNAASEISNRLGQDKADEFLTDILTYTERSLTENRLSGAITEFFGKFRQEALKNGELNAELSSLSDIFNSGLDIFIDKDKMLPERLAQGHPPGVAFAINNFFSTDYTVAENKGSVVTMGFDYSNGNVERIEMTYAKEPEWLEDGPAGPGYYLRVGTGQSVTASELVNSETDGTISQVADYLRTEIGNEKAAALLATLTSDSNVMEAVASTIAIVATENGLDQAIEYVRHLNGNLKNAINSVAPEGLTFDGWTIHSPLKSSKASNSGLTLHSSMDDIFEKGRLALDSHWQNDNGVGVSTQPRDLTELYSRLS
jgi:hypothetical protein